MNQPVSPFLESQTFVAFDTETTGLWAPFHRLVEVGAVKFSLRSEKAEVFQALINPGRKMPAKVIKVHGITDDMVQGAPPVEQVLAEFGEFIEPDAILVAHHAPFDLSFLACESQRVGVAFPDISIVDSIDLYRRYESGLTSYSLRSLAQKFDIVQTQRHRALADAEVVYHLIRRLLPKIPDIGSRTELGNSIRTYSLTDWQPDKVDLPPGHEPLAQAIACDERVKICYEMPPHQPSWRIVLPKSVYSVAGRVYLNAWCEGVKDERTFRVDRITGYQTLLATD